MLSPGNTAVGLTSDEPGAKTDAGEPDIYYPTGVRNYARIVPKDTVQGAALATIMDQDGCTRTAILHDKEVYGAGLAANIEIASAGLKFRIVSNAGIDPRAANYRSLAATLATDRVDCFVFSGITANGAVQLFKDVSAAIPTAKLYGPDGVSGYDDGAGVRGVIGAKALWLVYAWLGSAIAASWLSDRKGYGERSGLASGLLLPVVAVVIWILWPARTASRWKIDGPYRRRASRRKD